MTDWTLKARTAHDLTLASRPSRELTGSWPESAHSISVVLIVMDDVGVEQIEAYDDVNLWHAETSTPEFHYPVTTWMSALADRGVRCNYAYSSPVCSPTRAQLLTGRYPHIRDGHLGTGIGHGVNAGATTKLLATHYPFPVIMGALNTAYYKIAAGKWHLGAGFADPMSPIEQGGFDSYKGSLTNPNVENSNSPYVGSHYNWWRVIATAAGYATNYQTDKFMATTEFGALRSFVSSRARDPNNPFSHDEPFVAVWYCHSAHSILDAVNDDAGPSISGVTTCLDLTTTFTEAEQDVTTANNVGMRRHHSHIEAIDTLCSALDDAIPSGLKENTLFIVIGDNGTAALPLTTEDDDFWGQGEEPPAGRYNPDHHKGTVYDGGIHIPFIMGGDFLPTAVKGTSYNHPVDVVDIMPTILDLVESGWSSYLDGLGLLGEVDGKSLVPLLSGGRSARTHSLAQSFTPNGAQVSEMTEYNFAVVNENRWKLIDIDGTEELYYLGGTNGVAHGFSVDPLEATDLIDYADPNNASFNADVWEEYSDLKTYLTQQIWTEEERLLAPPPYSAGLATPVDEPIGTLDWQDNDNERAPIHLAWMNSEAQVASFQFGPTTTGFSNHPRVRLYTTSTGAQVYDYLCPGGTEFTALIGSSLGASSSGDGFAVIYQTTPNGLTWSRYTAFYDTSSTAEEWSVHDTFTIYGSEYNNIFVSDDAATVVAATTDPFEPPHPCHIKTYAASDGTLATNVSYAFLAAELDYRAASDDTTILASCTQGEFDVVTTSTGAILYQNYSDSLHSKPAILADGSLVIVSGTTKTFKLVASGGTYVKTVLYSDPPWTSAGPVALSSDGTTAAAVLTDLYSYSAPMYRVIVITIAGAVKTLDEFVIGANSNKPVSLHLSSDGSRLVSTWSGGDNGQYQTLIFWENTGTWSARQSIYSPGSHPLSPILNSDGTKLALATSGQWNIAPTRYGKVLVISIP